MEVEFLNFVASYGYFSIFALVFLQELGIPNPITNEFVLLFSGYLAFTKTLSLFWVIITVILADFIGTSLLYGIFYFFGKRIIKNKPKWLPFSISKIETLQEKLSSNNWWKIFLGRLIPFVRGYISVGAGIINVKPKTFLIVVAVSACIWAGGYAFVGFLFGNKWEKILLWSHGMQGIILLIVSLVILISLISYGFKIWKKKK